MATETRGVARMQGMAAVIGRRAKAPTLEERARRLVARIAAERRAHGGDLDAYLARVVAAESAAATPSRYMQAAVETALLAHARRACGLPIAPETAALLDATAHARGRP